MSGGDRQKRRWNRIAARPHMSTSSEPIHLVGSTSHEPHAAADAVPGPTSLVIDSDRLPSDGTGTGSVSDLELRVLVLRLR